MPRSETESVANRPVRDGLPRILELLIAGAGLILCSPIIAVAALAVTITSRGSACFRQERIGVNATSFFLIKLRTMRCSGVGPQITAAGDHRITAIGRFLRKTKLDEVPQLWNVLRGDMSLVGPRPEVPQYVDPGDALWQIVLKQKPGIVDPVTLRLRNEEDLLAQSNGDQHDFYTHTLQRYKLKAYVEYMERRSWIADLGVLSQTIVAVLFPGRFPPPTLAEIIGGATADAAPKPDGKDSIDRSITRGLSGFQPSRVIVRQVQFGLDAIVLGLSFLSAYLFRFDFAIPAEEIRKALIQLPFVVAIQFATLILTGVYSFIWRYVGMAEVRTFVKAATLATLPVILARLALPTAFSQIQVPLSIAVMDAVFAFGGVLGLRVLRRALHEALVKRAGVPGCDAGPKKSVLLIGAGRAGVIAAKEILDVGNSALEIKGFVDDDPNKQGSVIQAIKVLGTTRDLPRLVREHQIDHVVISIAKATRGDFRRILDVCDSIPVKVRVIPGIYELLQGKVKVSRIRDLRIEDLLGREPVRLDEEQMKRFLVGKTVLVTGAGGSIGSELARQVARFEPARLLLVERAEFALFEVDRDLETQFPGLAKVPLVADIGDVARMASIFAAYHADVVLHAAAHKHVPMMESNVSEAVKNNVIATRALAQLAAEHSVEVFVMVSTDKAVRPTSVMGATKRIAELVVQDFDRHYDTRYVAVRFGNVIGSTGSVIPIFRDQILRGGPVTVTHPEMTRYFMTIPEAAQLVLQAGAIGGGGEIFILDMGEPVRILDLATEAIILSGLKPYEDIDIVFTGVRPGEKLFEELGVREEQVSKTSHPRIFVGKIAAYPEAHVASALERLELLSNAENELELRRFLNRFLPEARIDPAGNAAGKRALTDQMKSGPASVSTALT